MADNTLHKPFVGERTLRRCAKVEAKQTFVDVLEIDENVLEAFAIDNVMNCFNENQNKNQNCSQNAINNVIESVHSSEQLSGEISDDANNSK